MQGLTEYNFGNSAVMKSYWLLLGCMLVLKLWAKHSLVNKADKVEALRKE